MPDRIKVDQFNGLYTNVDESKLNPEYQSEAVNVRFRTGYVESEGYVGLLADLPANVIYAQMVRLDEDRFKNRLDDQGELVPDYTQDLTDHMLSIYNDNGKLSVFIDEEEVIYKQNHKPVFSSTIKVWNSNGIALILTESGTYWVGKINRLTSYPTHQTVGFYLYKYVDTNFLPSMGIEIGIFADERMEADLTLLSFEDRPVVTDTGTDVLRYYTIQVKFPNGNEQGTYRIAAVKYSAQTEFYILIRDYEFTIVGITYKIETKKLWDSFAANVAPPDNWQPYIDYNQIQKIIGAENLMAKLIFAEENRFVKPDTEFVFTYTFNGRDEYALNSIKYKNSTEPGYVFKLTNFSMPGITGIGWDLRITNINLYMRQDDKDDFEQIMSWDINRGKPSYKKFDILYVDMLTPNGVFLSQTIGTVYKPKEYKPIDKFTDYLEIDGIAYAVSEQRIYHPSIGSGMIMNGVFLDYIPEVEGDLLSDINGSLGVFGEQLKLVVAQDSREGYLLFSIKDKMNFKIRDQYDLATSPEGIIIHTKRGIYVTNGYERKMISEEINNLIEANFETGNISYSPTDEMLFYTFKLGNEHFTFRYDFIYGKWSEIKPGIPGRLTFSESGIIHYLNESEGKVYKLDISNDVYSIVRTPNVDLDYPFLGKNLIYIDVDFGGILNYFFDTFNSDGTLGEPIVYTVEHTSRRTARLGIPVSKRIPNALIGARFIFKGKIYTIDIYYDAIGEFRHEDHIPSSETVSEGVHQYPKLFESATE